MRDYGTGSWEGGDPDCDHVAPPKGGPHTASTLGPKRDGLGPDNAAWADSKRNPQYAHTCGKCGATRQDQQLGLEATPDEYVARMVEVFREVRRVLAAHGTCWVNLGDSYAGSWGAQSRGETSQLADRSVSAQQILAAPKRVNTGSWTKDHPTLKPKDLCGIPWRVAFALQADGWYLRSDIVWAKPNSMPESVTDRPTKAHEYVFLLTKRPRYFFDQEAVREPAIEGTDLGILRSQKGVYGQGPMSPESNESRLAAGIDSKNGDPSGRRNIRSVWEIKQTGRPRGARHTLHDDYFADIDSEPKAYWLGFLWADGYLGRRHVDVQLAEKDADHLAVLQAALGSSRSVTISHDGRARFIASSLRMADDLRTLGMGTKQHVPLIDHSLVRHFMRGVFDGDGSAWKYLPTGRTKWRYGAQFLGHVGVLERVRDDLGLRGKPTFSRGIHKLNVAAAADIARLYDYLYTDASVWLERKRVEFPQVQSVAPDTWPIATQPYPEAHFATYPEELVRRCLLAGCPEWVCRVCGAPRTRIVEKPQPPAEIRNRGNGAKMDYHSRQTGGGQGIQDWYDANPAQTLGWTDCDCDLDRWANAKNRWRPGVVLDPFVGSGTTCHVARKHGRHAVGIDLNLEYLKLAARRLQQQSLFADVAP